MGVLTREYVGIILRTTLREKLSDSFNDVGLGFSFKGFRFSFKGLGFGV